MNTFDVFAGNDVKEQMEKLHECVTQYIDHIKDTVEAQSNKNGKAIDVEKILSNLGDIKSNLIDALLSKKASNYVLHSLNVVYNFDAFLNPIAATVVTYAIRQLYINKIGLEIINNINNVIKCVCMDMIARSKANRGLAEVSSMSKDYNMKISEVISITQKYVDSRDTQVMQMLDQTIQHDIEGFKENLESADKLIEAFSQNDKWVAEWGITTKAITLQTVNNLCLKIRKDMGSYITALSTCLDRHVVDNIDFKGVYNEHSIDAQIRDNEKQIQSEEKGVAIDESDKKAMISKGKGLAENRHIKKYSEYKELSDEDKQALTAYWKANQSKIPNAMRYVYEPTRFRIALKDICDNIQGSTSTDESNGIVIGNRFYELMGVEDLRLYIYDTLDFEYSNSVENLIKNRYSIMKFDKRIKGAHPSKSDKIEILRSKNKMLVYVKALAAGEKYGKK
jgi:hypothetical protein